MNILDYDDLEKQINLLKRYIHEKILYFEQYTASNMSNSTDSNYYIFDFSKVKRIKYDTGKLNYHHILDAAKKYVYGTDDKIVDSEEFTNELILFELSNYFNILGISYDILNDTTFRINIGTRIDNSLVKKRNKK